MSTDEVSGFFNIPKRINDEEYFDKHANNSLKDLLRNFTKETPVQFYLVTNEKISQTIIDEFELLKDINENHYEHYSFEFIKSFLRNHRL